MAQGIVLQFQDTAANSGTQASMSCYVMYRGVDVPGGSQTAVVVANFADTATIAQIASAIAAAVQAYATSLGFTVPSGNTLIPSYTRV